MTPLPCPFCGGNNIAPLINVTESGLCCTDCNCRGPMVPTYEFVSPFDNKEVLQQILTKWNHRV